MSGQPPKKKPGGNEPYDRRNLVKAYQDVVQEEQQKRARRYVPEQTPARKIGFWTISLGILLGCGLAVTLHPEWFFPKERIETPEIQDASLRLLIYREIIHVEQFRRANGRLPNSLSEAGGGGNGVEYSIEGGGYRLKARNGAIELTYNSNTPAGEFVGDSYAKVRGRTS
ncbi:MAG TPA: hypothetical protein VFU03_10110 [Gemmatimonadales bacterium]|nr:hypothetical protein [Gemmatimonadales bacterium]